MPPNPRPIPHFIADTTQEGIPHGRFAERLTAAFREAVEGIEDLPEGAATPDQLDWFPERAWGGRIWVPCSTHTASAEGKLELFGHVSYVQPPGGDPSDFQAKADFTDVLAETTRTGASTSTTRSSGAGAERTAGPAPSPSSGDARWSAALSPPPPSSRPRRSTRRRSPRTASP